MSYIFDKKIYIFIIALKLLIKTKKMKRIKHYSIRKNYTKKIINKTFISVSIMALSIFWTNFFWLNQLTTNVLWKIPKTELFEKAKKITFDGTTWPIKNLTDLSYRSIKNSNMTYEQIRKKTWDQIPDSMRTTFPTKILSYINKYKNITLQQSWNVFSDPEELNEFTFKRRVVRATWTASYSSSDIWKKDTWTHAWVDIMANVWTPIYVIANGLVIEKKESNKWFGNYIAILHKVEDKYYLSFYGHMHSLNNKIKVGDFVQKWELIWTVWHSWNAFWAHLHLQINKVFTLQDIVNGKVMFWWYHDWDGVKAYTIDPISFIEKHYIFVWDNLVSEQNKSKIWKTEDTLNTKENTIKNTIKNTQEDDVNLVSAISKKLEEKTTTKVNQHGSAPEKAYIKNIDLKLIDNKIQLWHSFETVLSVFTGDGAISIIASNENLQFTKDKIENPSKNKYTIQFIAKSVWETTITFNDGKSSQSYDVRIYKKETEKIYWIKVESNNLNMLSESKITIYPTNKFWQIIDYPLKWDFKIYLEINDDNKLLQNIQIDGPKYTWYIRWNMYWKWKLIIESDKFYSKTNIAVDVSQDYPYDSEYAQDMSKLIKAWIVKWNNGKLYPNRNITRRELLTILWRSILNSNYNDIKLQMQKYIKTNGRFFKDISGDAYSDPYVYIAWKKKIIKWENNYSLVNTYVSKWELLVIFTRLFNLEVKGDPLSAWDDLQTGTQLKKVADTVKKYGLYPFKNYNNFNAWKIISRIVAFETIQRFLDYGKENDKYISSNTQKKELEKELNKMFEF